MNPAGRGARPAGGPSALYGPMLWRGAVGAARWLPRPILRGCARLAALAYAAWVPRRRRVVAENLLPVMGGDAARARAAAWRTFAAFGAKLADLWLYEAGKSAAGWFTDFKGGERLTSAIAEGKGVLLLTPHLGNWEFGAPLLAARGIRLLVITLAEPGDGFTEFRSAARARWGIETLVIGEDPFAFVEIIRRLGAGAVVALLVDRPLPATAVEAELFGRPFRVSVAGAELARASGCVLLPTILPWTGRGYGAEILPPMAYDRRALGSAPARRGLAQDILRAFEPAIRQYPEQWFHFVPVWPGPESPPPPPRSPWASRPPGGLGP